MLTPRAPQLRTSAKAERWARRRVAVHIPRASVAVSPDTLPVPSTLATKSSRTDIQAEVTVTLIAGVSAAPVGERNPAASLRSLSDAAAPPSLRNRSGDLRCPWRRDPSPSRRYPPRPAPESRRPSLGGRVTVVPKTTLLQRPANPRRAEQGIAANGRRARGRIPAIGGGRGQNRVSVRWAFRRWPPS